MIPGGVNELLLRSAAAGGATAGRSVRFNSADSSYFSRGFSSGDQKKWTWSCWCKPCVFSGDQGLFGVTGAVVTFVRFKAAQLDFVVGGATHRRTTAVFRDPSAWYHFVWAVDTSQSTASNRSRFYVNGVEVTAWSIDSALTQNSDTGISSNATHLIGSTDAVPNDVLNAYLALVHFVGGQQLTPSSFGETSATTGQWIAKTYSGSYGTNGFFLDFLDNSTAAALGYDAAGSNDWTVNNLSVTAGSGNDSLRDHPTSAGTSTGLGGEVSGNYATLNPIAAGFGSNNQAATFSNGNLDWTTASTFYYASAVSTIAPKTGKYYVEAVCQNASNSGIGFVNAASISSITGSYGLGAPSDGWHREATVVTNNNSNAVTGMSALAVGDIIGLALDLDNGKAWWSKNGTWHNSGNPANGTNATVTFTPGNKDWLIGCSMVSPTSAQSVNFGQRAWAYTCPSGFSPLVDTLLPTPTIAKPNTVMDVALWTGNGTTTGNTQTISGLGFSPDLVWIKERSSAGWHVLCDTVRGTNKTLYSNDTYQEESLSNVFNAFNSDGFQVAYNSSYTSVFTNRNSQTYAGWCWDAGSSNATNTSGTITSTVRANISAGFSVVTYTGVGYSNVDDNFTVGHGLGVKPAMIIIKKRSATGFWAVWHTAFGDPAASGTNDKYIILNSTGARGSLGAGYLYKNASTSSVFGIGVGSEVNGSGSTFVAYCWTPVAGLSSFGSYVGNGSSDGPFAYTGFRPAFVILKTSTLAGQNWMIYDNKRGAYNLNSKKLAANESLEENNSSAYGGDSVGIDFLSNGFKIRTTGGNHNNNGDTYIYACFAEAPLPYARAR